MEKKKTLSVFFDTEFAGGIERRDAQRYLISIGLVAADGREFYGELTDTWADQQCSDWVVANVLPLLEGGECQMGVETLASRLKAWIEGLSDDDTEVVLRTDAPHLDWPFVEEMFKFYGWPKNLRKKYGTVYFESDRQSHRYNNGVEDYFKTHGKRKHHALVDARSMQYAWKYAIRRGF